MVNFRQQIRSNGREGGNDGQQNGRQGGGARRVGDPWVVYEELVKASEALEHLAQEAEAQHKASRYFTTTQTTSIVNAGQLFENLHLPEEAAIASAYIENNSAVTHLTVFEGRGASGRVVALVGPGRTKRIAVSDYISSLSIVADVADPSAALVIVTITSHKWSPASGTV